MKTPHFSVSIKRYLPKSFLGRSIIIIITPLILLQVVATWIFYDRHWDLITRRLADSVAGEIGLVIDGMEKLEQAENRAWLIRSARDLRILFNFKDSEILPNKPREERSGILDTRLANAMQERVRRPFQIDTWSHERLVRMKVQLPDGVMEIVVPRERLFSSTTYIFVMWMVGTSFLLFAIATMFMKNQVRPIRRLAAAVDNFGKGRDVPGFKPEGATEIRMAATAFERMRSRINNAMTQRTEMLAGVSHDLRTPLTRMKLQLALLENTPEVSELENNLREMEIMVEEFLAFAGGEGTEDVVQSNLGHILSSVVRSATASGGNVKLNIEDNLIIFMRPNAVKRCVANLVVNALAYANCVQVSAGRRESVVEICVDDDGPGIPLAEREAVFKPFYRLDASRNSETGGTGLGLSIARDLARGAGGDVKLEQSNLGGLRACVNLPI